MPVDLHYICKQGENFRWLGEDLFETGNWTAGDELADLAVGGRIFLHIAQQQQAWHGGTILERRSAPAPETNRKIFTYRTDFEFRIFCSAPWSQQIAVAWWSEDRTSLLTREEYLRSVRMRTPGNPRFNAEAPREQSDNS